jgi:hypothetical protein
MHMVRRSGDSLAWDAIQARLVEDETRVVLTDDAVSEAPPSDVETRRDAHAARARGVEAGDIRLIEYDEMVAWMEWAEKVVVW